jgi:hypothetical protein
MDVLCTDDLDEFGRDIDDPLAELDQDVLHMLLESFGSNPDALSRGVSLRAALSGPVTVDLRRQIETRLTTDARISAARATLTEIEASSYRIDLVLQLDEEEIGMTFITDAAGNIRRAT